MCEFWHFNKNESEVEFLFVKHAEKINIMQLIAYWVRKFMQQIGREVQYNLLDRTVVLQLESVFYFLTPVNTCLQVKNVIKYNIIVL